MKQGKKVKQGSQPALSRSQSSAEEVSETIKASSLQADESCSRDPRKGEGANPVDDVCLEANSCCRPKLAQCIALLQLQYHHSDETTQHLLEFYSDKTKRRLARSFSAGYNQAVEDVSEGFLGVEAAMAMPTIIYWLEMCRDKNSASWEQMTQDLPIPPDEEMDNWAKGWNIGYNSAINILRINSAYLTSNTHSAVWLELAGIITERDWD